MVTQFHETGAKPASLLLAHAEERLLPALRGRIDPQSHTAIRQPRPANARQYDALLTFWVEVPGWGNSLKRNKKGGCGCSRLRTISPVPQICVVSDSVVARGAVITQDNGGRVYFSNHLCWRQPRFSIPAIPRLRLVFVSRSAYGEESNAIDLRLSRLRKTSWTSRRPNA
jgi:hypothetical protein